MTTSNKEKLWGTFTIYTFRTVKDIRELIKDVPDDVLVEIQWYDENEPTFELVSYE